MDKEAGGDGGVAIPKGVFGILVFFLGALGIHDFAAKRFLYGCGHLILFVVAIAMFRISQSSFLPPTLIMGSWIWAIWENIVYQKSDNIAATREGQLRGFIAMAIVAEIITGLTILLSILATVINISGRNCYASGCDGAGWAIVIEIWIGLPVVFVTVFLISATLTQRKNYLALYKSNRTILYHTIVISILSIALAISIITALLMLAGII